ncbi:MAG TPA: PAS domain-containing protein [Alphaproteobacteria bacterium]|nr:PAS domain-containing protein [Alphaproteobacteria bacterium]
MSDEIPFKDADQRLHAVLRYWTEKRGDQPMPSRRQIDPLELGPAVLPHLMLVDVEPGPRFRYRLFGTAVSEAFGTDPTGQYIDAVMVGKYKDFLLGLYQDLITMKKPVYSTSIYGAQRDAKMWTQRLMLPLSSDGESVDMVLACQVFLHGSPLKTLTVRLAQDKAEPIDNIASKLD